ncbi:Histone-lysine N-methyltransferase ATXR3 [Raphanus sativus]|uniref:Histone-lysine N-methyltransferase ATXR3 n=1 Tax=Raphanus sativus TaxID=3726 RepID=A0A6J0MDN9_RAPSA|nr:histone-lysine N-methyltransferase ATXR3 [Raphanus sativus]XP_018470210.1 histone-lysine N-methyltransferase ATXR3 [Raphanus sativus]KAJ4912312.1 Histone-lysine N-methyltransferase ATXR3 [Raphanus sativus]
MRNGGVATCMPLLNIMDKLPTMEKKTLCGGGNNNDSKVAATSENGHTTDNKLPEFQPAKPSASQPPKKKKKIVKVIRKVVVRKPKQRKDQGVQLSGESQVQKKEQDKKSEVVQGKGGESSNKEENGGDSGFKDEVEEGELGTLNPDGVLENGEISPVKSLQRSEVEKGEISGETWKKDETTKGDYSNLQYNKWNVERRDLPADKYRKEEREFRSWRDPGDEIEKGEFIPDRWHKMDTVKDDHSYNRSRRNGVDREKYDYDYEHERTPPGGRFANEDTYRRREFRSGNDRATKISSKIVIEESLHKNEYNDPNNLGKEYSSTVNKLKRHGAEPDSFERKHFYADHGDYGSSKYRKLSDDSSRSLHPDHYSRNSVERDYRDSYSSKNSSLEKYPRKHQDSYFPARSVSDRHAHSPARSDLSPHDRSRYHGHRDRSSLHRERSPYARERSPYTFEKPSHARKKSPHDRSHHHDYRRSPSYSEWSSDRRDGTSRYMEDPQSDRTRRNGHREISRKSGVRERRDSQAGMELEHKHRHRDSNGKESTPSRKDLQGKNILYNNNPVVEKDSVCDSSKIPSACAKGKESVQVGEAPTEELPSMEVDMDICDTPPHEEPLAADSSLGKWFYLDYYGTEHGPAKLSELKALMEQGILFSDHMIKHSDNNRWVTIENATSPVVNINTPSIVSDTVTQLVNPPEAPGNLLEDIADAAQAVPMEQGAGDSLPESLSIPDSNDIVVGHREDFQFDNRIASLLEGYTITPGRELETLGEAMQIEVELEETRRFVSSEDIVWCYYQVVNQLLLNEESCGRSEPKTVAIEELKSENVDNSESDETGSWFSGRWSCKGGDWIRHDEAFQDRDYKTKMVLNDGFPLCLMQKSGYEDPRWHHKDDLYNPCSSSKLELPLWAFSGADERNQARGVKANVLSVVRLNSLVVSDQVPSVPDPLVKVRSREKFSSRHARPSPASCDSKRESVETISQTTACSSQDLQRFWKTDASVSTPGDRLYTVDDLHLHLGDWFYMDGAGQEQGPLPFSELQILVDKGLIKRHTSVFRKSDKIWVPVTSITKTSEISAKLQGKTPALPSDCQSLDVSESQDFRHSEMDTSLSSFHAMHPQFLGYFRGKLHQLIMKTYKTREFSAAINDVLDSWIHARQPKKETDKYMHQNSEFGSSSYTKRARLMAGESRDHSEVEDAQMFQKDELAFEDLCGDATFHVEGSGSSGTVGMYWDLLDGHVLARVFHLLRYDVKSLAFASMTCRHWKAVVSSYKDISRQVDLSSLGTNCTDSRLWSIMNTYNTEKIDSIILVGCTNVTSSMLEEILRLFPHISSVDITGCSQFGNLTLKYKKLSWLKCQHPRSGDLHSRLTSLKQTNVNKSKGLGGDTDDFGNLKDYFDRVEKRDSANQLFRRSLYKRSKLYDARKSSAILSRDARIRRWAIKKSEHGYKRVEEFLASSLRGIMMQNTFDFFVLKVAQIEEKMKNGYYVSHGLKSVKEDISRMCRQAIKERNRGDSKDMNRIIILFIQLATCLEEVSMATSSYRRDELMKSWQDGSGLSSASKYNTKLSKSVTEKKYMSRTGDTFGVNGALDYGEYASDREIKRRLSKLNRKSFGSGSETSSELSDNDNYSSASESESDIRSEGRSQDTRVEKYFTADESFDSVTEEREWGARMTKASLVPPVTRKYELIEEYTIVADEEEVRRKMRVSLPEDYGEKLNAQRNGIEELDMELPEVKEYKPRKLLGNEVLEQEVYGIDPYTHNLLLDSMPGELDWSLQDKHSFIEDVVLRALNRKVRFLTGSGNTPMVYPLRPVIEELKENSREECDIQTMRMCQGVLKAIESRSGDTYVSYRKGLGVVCNKQGGFVEDDFVVEFLGEVYPVWKWFEKQDGIRSLQENKTDPAPEFYNIYLERPKGDADGYDLVVVDAMHKANYASRICHSCRPNCEAKVTAVDGHYQIGIYSVRPIEYGEEITFDYNSVTESKEEYEASVCLCGSHVCRGSYLNLTGEGAFQKVLKEWHGLLDRHRLMLEACMLNSVSEEDYLELGRAGLGSCLLGGLPDWVIAYSAHLVRFINFERTKLPVEILKHNMEEKIKYFSDIHLDVEKSDAEVQAEGVYNQRLQNLAVTLDKVRYVMRRVFGDPKNAPPPLEKLTPEETVSFLWNGDGSLVEELLQCLSPHVEVGIVDKLRSKIRAHDPSGSADVLKDLQRSLLWLRDEIRDLPCTYKCRNDAAADLIHIYAYTKCLFKVREYKSFMSSPVHISPLDLGAKYADKLGEGIKEYRKTYGENYCLGQLIYWYEQTNTDPDLTLVKATRGCLSLPEVASFYAKAHKPSKHRVYGPKTVKTMVSQMSKQPQKPWAKDKIWMFKSSLGVLGSPMFDTVLNNSSLDRELVQWLRNRRHVFQATWDS